MIEPLESRIAPASVFTYVDWDGDTVKVTASKGVLSATDFTLSAGVSGQLEALNLTGGGFEGAAISIVVTHKAHGGDGEANVGYINATGVDLASLAVGGDLGRVDAGTDTAGTPAIGTLSVKSIGEQALSTQAAGGSLSSTILGKVNTFKVAGDVVEAAINVDGASGGLGTLTIGGSLIGGSSDESGSIRVGDNSGNADPLGRAVIGKDIIGGSGAASGLLAAFGPLQSVTVGGSIIGGANSDAGTIFGTATLGSVVVHGSLIGGASDLTGSVYGQTSLASVVVFGNVVGGSNAGSDDLNATGIIASAGHVGTVTVKGSIIAGANSGSGTLSQSGAIYSGGADLKSVTIDGSIIGNSAVPVLIQAVGESVKPASGINTAIGSVIVKGSVTYGDILAGFDSSLAEADADASIGKIIVGGNWRESNLVAGAHEGAAGNWGTGDSLQTVGNTSLIASIGSITISGYVTGSPASGDNFGFVAQIIGSVKIGGRSITPVAGSSPVFLNTDVDIEEVM